MSFRGQLSEIRRCVRLWVGALQTSVDHSVPAYNTPEKHSDGCSRLSDVRRYLVGLGLGV
jgi:hypothetical protein